MLRRFGLRLAVIVTLWLGVLAVLAGPAAAQRGVDILSDEECRNDPNSEECICRDVLFIIRVPKPEYIDYSQFPPQLLAVDSEGVISSQEGFDATKRLDPVPYQDPFTGQWIGHEAYFDNSVNNRYSAYCSLEYFREDLRRLVYFLVALAAGLAVVSVAWAGTVHMMDSASAETRSQVRTTVIRVILGLVILSMIFVAFEGIAGLFVGDFDLWSEDPGLLEGL